jgi:hypothetical protein
MSDTEPLAEVGRRWGRHWARALPVDPGLGRYPSEVRPRGASRFVPVGWQDGQPPELEAEQAWTLPRSVAGRAAARARRLLLGAPLKSTAVAREHMRKLVALPVLSADALSSVAYGPEAMLAILVLGGSEALALSLPIAGAIAALMLAVGASYRQTLRA